MNTRLVTSLIGLITGLALLSGQAFAISSVRIAITTDYYKGNNLFNIVVKDTPGTKLELYVNGKNPTKSTANKKGWATFDSVRLVGSGKISFTSVVDNKQQPINYTRHYVVARNKVSFTATSATTVDKPSSVTKSIPFTTTTVQDASLAKGTIKITTQGVDGMDTLNYANIYVSGKYTSRKLVSTVVNSKPITQIESVGTYVAPASSTSTSSTTSSTTSPISCYPLSDEGGCYEPGEYCRDSDQGTSGVAGNGESITCEDNDGWRWESN